MDSERPDPPRQDHLIARPRQNLYHAGDTLKSLPVICEGFAFRFVILPDGRRQILSFLMPGDMIWGGACFVDRLQFSVQGITAVRYRAYDREWIRSRLLQSPSALMRASEHCAREYQAAEQAIVNLGRRGAEERVAQLMLDFVRCHERFGIEGQGPYAFPLKQLHIADAVGLTQIHVSRVINKMKRAKVIDLDQGMLSVLDHAALEYIGEHGARDGSA